MVIPSEILLKTAYEPPGTFRKLSLETLLGIKQEFLQQLLHVFLLNFLRKNFFRSFRWSLPRIQIQRFFRFFSEISLGISSKISPDTTSIFQRSLQQFPSICVFLEIPIKNLIRILQKFVELWCAYVFLVLKRKLICHNNLSFAQEVITRM